MLAAADVIDSPMIWCGVGRLKEQDGALLLRRRPLVLQSFTSGLAVDVAFCDPEMQVMALLCLGRHGMALPRLRAATVIVARSGAFERWNLSLGDCLEVKGA